MAVCVLANADASTVILSDLAKTILDGAESAAGADPDGGVSTIEPGMPSINPTPLATSGTAAIRFSSPGTTNLRKLVTYQSVIEIGCMTQHQPG